MSGRTRTGACGHVEAAVIGNFYVCTVKGCTGKSCPKCGSPKVEKFNAIGVPDNSNHCWDCGKCWWP